VWSEIAEPSQRESPGIVTAYREGVGILKAETTDDQYPVLLLKFRGYPGKERFAVRPRITVFEDGRPESSRVIDVAIDLTIDEGIKDDGRAE
jgi:hypothetical protein